MERERIRNNIMLRKQQDLEDAERERRREEKVQERRKELGKKVVQEALEKLRQQKEDVKTAKIVIMETTQDVPSQGENVEPHVPIFVLDTEKCKGIDFNCPRIPPALHYHVC